MSNVLSTLTLYSNNDIVCFNLKKNSKSNKKRNMKKCIKLVLLVVLANLSLTTKSQTQNLDKFIVPANGNLTIYSWSSWLLYNNTTGLTVICNNELYKMTLYPEINKRGVIINNDADFTNLVSSGRLTMQYFSTLSYPYYNTGYDKKNNSIVSITWKKIEVGFYYICLDGEPLAKANCGNIIQKIVVYVPLVKETPKPAPKPETMKMCLGLMPMGEERLSEGGDLVIGKFSVSGNYYYHYSTKAWYQKGDDGVFFQICVEKKPEPVVYYQPKQIRERIVYVDRYIERPQPRQQYVAQQRHWNVGFTYNPNQYGYRQQYYQQQPQHIQQYYRQEDRRLSNNYYYNNYRDEQPRPVFTGTSSNGGSQNYYTGNSSNGGSNGYSNGGNSSNGGNYNNTGSGGGSSNGGGYTNNTGGSGSNAGGGYIPGVHQRIGRK